MSRLNFKFGIILDPFRAWDENPAAVLAHDQELIELLEKCGYDYIWRNEQHSGGHGITSSSDVFADTIARSTGTIRLGNLVSNQSLQYPFSLARRITQLDHLTHGRLAFCIDPGPLPSEPSESGIDPINQLDRATEAIKLLMSMLKGERLSNVNNGFDINEPQTQFQPYSKPMVDLIVASHLSPAAARIAGTFGLGLLSINATSPGGFNALASNWEIYERKAAEHNQVIDRSKWSLAGPVHIAETRRKALDNVRYGLVSWINHYQETTRLPIIPDNSKDPARILVENGLAVIGTPTDAIAQIKRLDRQTGGYGCFLQMAHNWADWDQTRKSYELFAEKVVPAFQDHKI